MPRPPENRDLPGLTVLLPVLLTAVPAAVFAVPNTASYVVPQAMRDLGLADGEAAGFVRACGLALPALLLAMPPAAVLARRLPAWTVLFAGLAILLGAQSSAAYVTSVPLVGAVRAAEGAGAGAVLPAALVLAWERRERRLAAGVWAAVLTASLLLATPAVLAATPRTDEDALYDTAWRTIMHPYWWLAAAAFVGTGMIGLLRLRGVPAPATGRPARSERVLVMLPVAPAAGFAFLAVVTTYGWSPGAQLILAACAIAGLLGLAVVGSRGPVTGSPAGYPVVMIATGLFTVPLTGPLAGLLSVPGGGHAASLTPFVACAGCAVSAALAVTLSGRVAGRRTVLAGYALVLAAIALLFTVPLEAGRWALTGALCALGAGIGLAVGTALRPTEIGSGLFGLTLCLPAALGGHLMVGSLQVAEIGRSASDPLPALTEAYRMWLMAAGALVIVLALATARVSGRRPRGTTAVAAAQDAAKEPPSASGGGAALRAS